MSTPSRRGSARKSTHHTVPRTARPYWNMRVEPRLGTARLNALRLRRLRGVLTHVSRHSRYFQDLFGTHRISPRAIRSFEDFRATVPLFTKEDHRSAQETSLRAAGHGLGTTLAVPREDLRLFCATSGTTGEPTFYLFSDEDLAVWCEGRSRAFWRAGLRPGMRVMIGFGLGMFVGGIPNVFAARAFGLGIVPVGAEAGSARLLKFARLTRPHALLATPSLALHLIEQSPGVIGQEVRSLGLRVLLLGGEAGVGIEDTRHRLEDAYGARVFDLQGPNMSCSPPRERIGQTSYYGLHRLMDDFYYYELIDPETREPIPFEEGAVGELVTTQLWPGAAPFIRYTAGDLQQVFVRPCPCGATGYRSRFVGRTDDMLKVKGVIVYPAGIQGVLAAFQPCDLTGEFRIVLTEPPPKVTPPLRLKIEHAPGAEGRLPAIELRIKDLFHTRLKVSPEIQWMSPNTLPKPAGKREVFERKYHTPSTGS
ncbi:MAG: phenylacetate--CoA ligase family protein [Nitrospirae bacterium]|nr:phenylacetate--CoA ligase family protein [Nitrospirota bacterium]